MGCRVVFPGRTCAAKTFKMNRGLRSQMIITWTWSKPAFVPESASLAATGPSQPLLYLLKKPVHWLFTKNLTWANEVVLCAMSNVQIQLALP